MVSDGGKATGSILLERGGRLAVLGGGESGTGAAILGKKEGYEVFVSDQGPIKEAYKEVLIQTGIDWEEGGLVFNVQHFHDPVEVF